MKVLNYGSLNVDYVYSVQHIVEGGETILSSKLETFCGGKGLNQSIALAKAHVPVFHAGAVGSDGQMLLEACDRYGVNAAYIQRMEERGGHTVIQVDEKGQNCIILYGGTNQRQTRERIDQVLEDFGEGDCLVLQNEINELAYLIDRAGELGMKIVLNPSPFNDALLSCRLDQVWLFMLNEIEGRQFTGTADPDEILDRLHRVYPRAKIVLTLGSDGSVYDDGEERIRQGIFPVKAVDTTAAGDTFTGFFLGALVKGKTPREALRIASMASAIAVTRQGAAPSIPDLDEVEDELRKSNGTQRTVGKAADR